MVSITDRGCRVCIVAVADLIVKTTSPVFRSRFYPGINPPPVGADLNDRQDVPVTPSCLLCQTLNAFWLRKRLNRNGALNSKFPSTRLLKFSLTSPLWAKVKVDKVA